MKIGILFSLTGTTSLTETGQYRAALLAFEKFQEKTGKEIDWIVRDIQSDPSEAYRQAEDLAKNGVRLFVGTYTSACRQAILPILETYNGLLIYPTLYEGNESHPHVLYTGEVPNQQVYPLLKYIRRHIGSKVYLLGTDYIYPRSTNQDAREYWRLLGGTVCGEQYVPFGHANFDSIFQEIIRNGADAIVSTLVGTSLVHFYRSFAESGFQADSLPIFSPITKETEIQAAGPQAAAGHYSSGSYFQSLDSAENLQFIRDFKQRFGSRTVVSSVMFNTYLGVFLLLDTLQSLHTADSRDIRDALKGKRFPTPCGTVQIDGDSRHLSRPIRIGKIKPDGQFEIVWDSKELITPDPFLRMKHSPIDSHIPLLPEKDGLLVMNAKQEVVYTTDSVNEQLGVFEGDRPESDDLNRWDQHFAITEKKLDTAGYTVMNFEKKEFEPAPYSFDRIRTRTPVFQEELKTAQAAAKSRANILLLGETGSGKEVLARAIHHQSLRKDGPFISVNTGAIPRELISSELFGFADGAFTGAKKGGSAGKFEQAHQGTLFLDEIGEMPPDLQVALLRILETRTVTRLGDHRERKIDVRIIAATNRDLKEEIAFQGSFRSDLFYRLNVISIHIPPLRECIADIDLLVQPFISQLREEYQSGPCSISKEALKLLKLHSWPGNIRELKNCIERAFILSLRDGDRFIKSRHLPKELTGRKQFAADTGFSLQEAEKQAIHKALVAASSLTHAAQLLGISRSTLYRKLKDHSIDSSKFFLP
ncbi:transporter substrate-binding protein [Bacillus massiliglaciei]|uniref:transporter substrate-binding protein n=1 Tax=Bacillus massiliglaciei TaxID=1816693 RepID=UPI000AC49B9C|nr:transporter substrate-binding protein [Bacillus massiliglaciei]